MLSGYSTTPTEKLSRVIKVDMTRIILGLPYLGFVIKWMTGLGLHLNNDT